MKSSKNLFALLVVVLLINACTEDDPVIPVIEGPEINLNSGPGLVTSSDTVLNGETFSVQLAAVQGDVAMNDLRIQEDGSAIPFDRISVEGSPASANPILLVNSDRESFTFDIEITTSDEAKTAEYTFLVMDENNESATATVTVTTLGTAVDTLMGVLLNAAGPQGTGGLDLDEGIGTGSTDTIAEIKDEGIDLDLPLDQNWKRQISGTNGAIVKYLSPGENGLSESFAFENISTKEVIRELFDGNGIDFTQVNQDSELVSDPVTVGDVFVVQREEKHYLIRIAEITETVDDNNDSYLIDIKH